MWNDTDIKLDVSSQIDIPLLISDKDMTGLYLPEYSHLINNNLA